jgi:DNA-binding CsgD family transcriptional regulator
MPVVPSQRLLQRRTVKVLVVAQLLGALGLAAGGTAGALLAEDLTGTAASAGLPLAVLVLGSGVGAVAVTRIMDRSGRRVGLTGAHLGGALGAGLAVAAAALGSWPLLLAGCALLGGGNAAVMLARYAAADLASRRGRSISTVVAAASVGAVIGPNLLGPAGIPARTLGLPEPTGLFLLAMPAFLAALRVFVDEGAPMATLLGRLLGAGPPGALASQVPLDYLRRLTDAFQQAGVASSRRDGRGAVPGLVEPLSERELEVLGLLAVGRSNQQIADELVVALDTVKKHVSHILDKLGVANRTQAVARARQLELLRTESY